jgi:DNA-binding NarL/FixJ family response regulator
VVQRIRLSVRAPDLVTEVGLTTYLGSHGRVTVVPWQAPFDADVLVLVVDSVNAADLEITESIPPEARPAIVLVTNQLTEEGLARVLARDRITVLPLESTHGARLLEAVLASADRTGFSSPHSRGRPAEHRGILRAGTTIAGTGFTPREIEILRLLAAGWNTTEIANKLDCSERTVKNLIFTILRKTKLRNRQHAVAYAIRTGVI